MSDRMRGYATCQNCGQAIETILKVITVGYTKCFNNGFPHLHPIYEYEMPESEAAVFVAWSYQKHVGPFFLLRTYDTDHLVKERR